MLFLASLLAIGVSGAMSVRQMNLEDLCRRAEHIFRGEVVGIRSATVQAGGGEIPVRVFLLRVDEAFKGEFQERKGKRFVELSMLAPLPVTRVGKLEKRVSLPALPQLAMGEDLLLFTTRPGSTGLSTTVGLGQGCFRVVEVDGELSAMNGFGNRGLFANMDDAPAAITEGADRSLPYAEMGRRIRALTAAP